jgi:hypothetical protein
MKKPLPPAVNPDKEVKKLIPLLRDAEAMLSVNDEITTAKIHLIKRVSKSKN